MPAPSQRLRASARAPAKLNLSLRVVGRRADGYHLLDSCIVPISLYDRLDLSFIPGPQSEVRCAALQPGLPADDDNLAGRAARLFMSKTGLTGSISIQIDKQIPVGAGLGGGSSDAAAVLRMLHRGVDSGVDVGELADWSVVLGADVPFFVHGLSARVRGIGEKISASPPQLSGPIVVAFPGTPLSTAAVYRAYDDSLTRCADLSSGSVFASDQRSLREILANDLEAAAIEIYPPLRLLKTRMIELGARGALMTGSGSAVFGVWENDRSAQAAATTLKTVDGIWAKLVEVIEHAPEVELQEYEGDG